MNERLKELAEQAGMYYRTTSDEFCEADKDGVPIEMMERFAELVRQDYLRELRALKPVAYMDSKGVLFNNTTHPHLHTALYALDGEQA